MRISPEPPNGTKRTVAAISAAVAAFVTVIFESADLGHKVGNIIAGIFG